MTAAASASAAMLVGLSAVCAALLALAPCAVLARAIPARALAIGLAGLGAMAAVLHLALGAVPARIVIPFHLAGVRPALVLDGLSGFFLVALLPVGAAALAMGAATGGVAVLLAGLMLALLAGETGSLILGVTIAAMAALVLLRQSAAQPKPGTAWPLAWVCAIGVPALAMALALPAGDGGFMTMRANPPQGTAATAMLALALLGGGGFAALAPGQTWLRRAATAPMRPQNALTTTVLTGLGAYLLIRLLFDLTAGPMPPWWGVPLLLAGALGAVRGAARAAQADDLRAVLAGMTAAHAGLVALGLGMALAARAVDDGPAAMLALGGALFGVLAFGWAQALWAVVTGAVAEGAGTQQLGRLGGLAQRMRITTIGALVGGLVLAMLPPGAGFAAVWLLLRAAVTLPRGGGADWWAIGLIVALALGLSGALLGFAVLRVLGVAFLGRPRTPRTAAAEEVAPRGRWTILALSGAVLACGLVPGVALALAGPALRMLAGPVASGTQPPGIDFYAPLGLAVLLAGAIVAVALAVRARSPAGHRAAPAWEDGRNPGPAWLPFGDPATQLGATGFAQHLGRCLDILTATPALPPHARLQRAANLAATWLQALPRRAGPALLGLMLLSMLLLHLVRAW